MTPERWQHIKKLLQSALERGPEERSKFLAEACAGDEPLRQQIELLIKSHEQAGDFIESPAFALMADSLEQQTESLVGRSFGHYRILSFLGAGGMGEVYLAEDTTLGRKAALKVLPPYYTSDDDRVRRFQQEARAASALNHPSIITIYEIGEQDSRHFIASEFIGGETLRQRMANTQIGVAEAVRIAIHIGSALAAAHDAGIIHRDIKPDNIMLREDHLVKVLDFGLAKLTDRATPVVDSQALIKTEQGMVMGTSYYMSPEQARGLAVDARSDIWSLGVVVYEMITARVPFEGETSSDVIASILNRKPISLARHVPESPAELDWIIAKTLRKDREGRYQTIKELLTDLRDLKRKLQYEEGLEPGVDTKSVEATRRFEPAKSTDAELVSQQSQGERMIATSLTKSSGDQPVHSSRPWLTGPVLLVAVIVLVATVTGVAYWYIKSRNLNNASASTPASPTFTQLTYQPGPEFFPSLSPDGQLLAYASRASGNWDIYVQRVGDASPVNLTKNSAADDSQPAFSPDGNSIVFRSDRDGGGIFLMNAKGESVVRVSDFGYSPSWSPDGTQILVGTEKIPQPSTRPSKSQLWAIDLKNNERRLLFEGDALQPHYSPNKLRIVFWSRPTRAGQREDIWTIPAQGGQAVRITNGSTTDVNPIWSPEGKYLYFSSSRGGSVNVWRVPVDEKTGATQGEPVAVTAMGGATSTLQLSLSRDGKRLVYISQQDVRNLRKVAFDPVRQRVTGEPVWISRGSLQLWFPEPSPDGEWLTACSRGQERHVYILRSDGSELRNLTNDNFRNDGWPRWSPDGQRIAFTSRRTGDYELWVINRDGTGLRQLTESKGGHYSPWSPDGSSIAYSTHVPKNDCIIIQADKTWSEQKLTYLSPLQDASLSFEGWAYSHDGKRIAGIRHLPNGSHSGIGIHDLSTGQYEWFTDFGDWPVWLNDDRSLLFVSQGKILLLDIASRKYREIFTVTDQDVDIGSPSLSPDNRTLYFTFVAAEADVWLMTFN